MDFAGFFPNICTGHVEGVLQNAFGLTVSEAVSAGWELDDVEAINLHDPAVRDLFSFGITLSARKAIIWTGEGGAAELSAATHASVSRTTSP
jgi:hypothetical protein